MDSIWVYIFGPVAWTCSYILAMAINELLLPGHQTNPTGRFGVDHLGSKVIIWTSSLIFSNMYRKNILLLNEQGDNKF